MDKTYFTDLINMSGRDDRGVPIQENENSKTCAIRIDFDTKDPSYQVRVDSVGDLYNPHDKLGVNRPTQKQRILSATNKKTDKTNIDFAEVSKDVFDSYLLFLKSNREIYLKQAKRLRG